MYRTSNSHAEVSVMVKTVSIVLILSGLFMVARDMAKEQGINESGYKLLFNVEKGGGQEIFHIHLHLIGGWKKK